MTFPFFIYDGVSCLDESLFIQSKNTYVGASRDVKFIAIPGRSGDLLTDNKRYKNVTVSYMVTAIKGQNEIPEIAHRVKGWLASKQGYRRLLDSYDPAYFRLGAYVAEFDLEQELPELGKSTIQFNCRPFKYLIAGETPVTMTEPGTITNPERFPSAPYIKITGSGNITLNVNNGSFVFKNVDEYIEVDSEIMNAFKGTVNCNTKMETPFFPELKSGLNDISWSGSVTNIKIIPRWCCL